MSLLEVMVSFSLLLLLTVFIVNLFPSSVLAMRRSEARLEGYSLCDSALEIFKNKDFSSLLVGSSTVLPGADWNGVTYASRVEVSAVSGYATSSLKQLKAVVSWEEKGSTRSVHRILWIWSNH